MKSFFRLGNTTVCADFGALPAVISGQLRVFSVLPETPELTFDFVSTDRFPEGETVEKKTERTCVLTTEGRLFVSYCLYGKSTPFGFYADSVSEDRVTVFWQPGLAEARPDALNLLTRCGLHSLLLRRNMPVIHASYIAFEGFAILFAGPSGTGKSTQASLWEKYAGAEIVNGDRALLYHDDGVWYACGYPAAGSSDICKNLALPVKAIVLLGQNCENAFTEVTPVRALRRLAAGIEVFRRNGTDMELAVAAAERLLKETRVLFYECRNDSSAVTALREVLF